MSEQKKEKSSYSRMKTLILENQIEPGYRLTESFLAEKLNLSRIPVREAMMQLIREDFIVRAGKNGYQIKEYDEQNIINLYNFREALDGMMARLFTLRADEEQIQKLEENVHSMESLFDNYKQRIFTQIDLKFHERVAHGAQNSQMEHQHRLILEKVLYISNRIFDQTNEKQKKVVTKNSYRTTLEEHKAILGAFKKRDTFEAERLTRESVQNSLMKSLHVLSLRF